MYVAETHAALQIINAVNGRCGSSAEAEGVLSNGGEYQHVKNRETFFVPVS